MKKQLVIADDDPSVQDIFQIIFSRAGYHVSIYSNGEPLLNNDFVPPDAFILDKHLSGIDYYAVSPHAKTCATKSCPSPYMLVSPLVHLLCPF